MYYKITNGAVSINAKTILEEINIEINTNDKIAIIGRNGAGKSTLLNALTLNDMLSEGISEEKFSIFKSGNPVIGILRQTAIDNPSNTLIDEILTLYKPLIQLEERIKKLENELEKGADVSKIDLYTNLCDRYKIMGGYEYKKEYILALKHMGFADTDYERKVSSFSGGEQTKIAFIKLLLSKPDILLLDEPTNHLDIKAIEWLEEYLKGYPKALVVVSHDRAFINKFVNKIYEIEYGKTEAYIGNYENYQKEKKRRYEKALKDYEYQQSEIKRLQRIADRFRYKPSKASMAMSKLKQIERMVKLDKPENVNDKTFNFKLEEFKKSAKIALNVSDLEIGYKNTLSKVSFELERGQKLGIIGENGTGKSTLLKTIMGKVSSISGKYNFGSNVTIGYFDQHLETLDKNKTIYEELSSSFPNLNDFEIRRSLASFMFYEEDVLKKLKYFRVVKKLD